jgi:riboflavin synthase
MFSGIIRATARVKSLTAEGVLTLSGVPHCAIGDSISVNGVCLTVTSLTGEEATFDVSPETLRRSNLGGLKPGECVNLEFPLALESLLHGHLVQGHVDGVGKIEEITKEGESWRIRISHPAGLSKYLVEKGSVTVNGISLTVGELNVDGEFPVYIIPKTWEWTNLSSLKVGDSVNLEVDIVAKYVERLLGARPKETGRRCHSA